MVESRLARFQVGQVVQHKLFNYRGAIVDVDAHCQQSEDWYQQMALTRPPRDRPWYHVLVDGAQHTTYVAERNLAPDPLGEPVNHPLIAASFSGFEDGRYVPRRRAN